MDARTVIQALEYDQFLVDFDIETRELNKKD
jgi:hypothetical protein